MAMPKTLGELEAALGRAVDKVVEIGKVRKG